MNNFENKSDRFASSPLSRVKVIPEARNQMVKEKKDIKDIVEQPLLEACEELYEKNIQTLSTSANAQDLIIGKAYVEIDFDSLSEKNKQIALQHNTPKINGDGINSLELSIPINESTTPAEIEAKAKELAGKFEKQPAYWIPKYNLSKLKEIYGIAPEEIMYDDPSNWNEYFYDPEEKMYYFSEEHFKKANERFTN